MVTLLLVKHRLLEAAVYPLKVAVLRWDGSLRERLGTAVRVGVQPACWQGGWCRPAGPFWEFAGTTTSRPLGPSAQALAAPTLTAVQVFTFLFTFPQLQVGAVLTTQAS